MRILGLLLGGLWGTAKVRYYAGTQRRTRRMNCCLHTVSGGPARSCCFRASRSRFTADEWSSLMLQSAGYSAGAFPDRRTRLILFARMVPLVERNVNLIELGPRQTGKTFLLRNLSPRVFTLSGGRTTPANLFVNLSTRQVGILGTRKVVVFDEIAHTIFSDEDQVISTLKDYMESGQFSRGALRFCGRRGIGIYGQSRRRRNSAAFADTGTCSNRCRMNSSILRFRIGFTDTFRVGKAPRSLLLLSRRESDLSRTISARCSYDSETIALLIEFDVTTVSRIESEA